jgi:3D (Asp-Asp-Asp) domain-containing protein
VFLATLELQAASGAESPSRLREHAQALRAQNSSLSTRERAAWLSSVSLETRLGQTQAALVRLRAGTEAISARRAEAEQSLRTARRTLAVSQERLADRLRLLYEEGNAGPMDVLVGAKSIDEAIRGLESLHRSAGQDQRVIAEARSARARLVHATQALAASEAEARQAEKATFASVEALQVAQRERAALTSSLEARRRSNSTTISTLESRAASLAERFPAAVRSGQTLVVTATGYSLTGRTATGVAVGYGIVAVDPGVIPLGTHLTIPGYGEGVAADTGGSVVGSKIDVWFPTRREALAWGTRTVTITLH